MKTYDQKFVGPGFETFKSNFSLISQKYDKRHTRCRAFTKLLKLINQLSKTNSKTMQISSSGHSRRTTTCWQSCRMTSRSFSRTLTQKMLRWVTTSGCAPVMQKSPAWWEDFLFFILLVRCPYQFWIMQTEYLFFYCLYINSILFLSWIVLPAICKWFFMQPAYFKT